LSSSEIQNSENLDNNFDLIVSYLADQKYIKIIARGNLTVEANQQSVVTAIEACRKFNCSLILLDERNVTVAMNFVDIYDLPQHNEHLGVSNNIRVAILYSQGLANDKVFRLYEDRAVISDFKHYIFYDEEAAIAWLLKEQ